MKLFKLIASRAGQVVFDDRLEAATPREAREQMKALLGLQSLTGMVYSITEIPVELIREIVTAKVLEVVGSRQSGDAALDVTRLVGDAANRVLGERLRPLEQRLAALENRHTAASPGEASTTTPARFDAFSRESTRNSQAHVSAVPPPNTEAEEPLPPVTDWRAVRRFYKHCRSPKQTAAHFDLSVNTVKTRARREGW